MHQNHTPGTSNSGPPSKGFERFLSILNKGVDLGRLTNIVNAPQNGPVDNKTHRSVDWNHDDSRDKERNFRCKRVETSVGNSHSRDEEREYRGNLGNSEERHRGSSGRRGDFRDKRRLSDEEKMKIDCRERGRGWDSRDKSWNSGEGYRDWDSRERDGNWNSRERDRSWNSGEDDRSWNSREGDRSWNSTEGDRSWNYREGDMDWDSRERNGSWNSRKEDRSLNAREEEKTWNHSEVDVDPRHRMLESRNRQWDQENRDHTSKTEDWDKEWRNGDREDRHSEHQKDSQSPSRRSSRDISSSSRPRSRSPSRILPSLEDKKTIEEREQFSRIQSLFQTVGLDLGLDELDRLSSRTQERLYGARPPGEGAQVERKRQRQCQDSSQSASSDDRSQDSHRRQQDSQEHRGDAEHVRRDSETQSIDFFTPANSTVQTISLSTLSQPPNRSSYAMTHNSSEGQHHSASVQSLTTGWNGRAHSPYDPQYPTSPTLSTCTTPSQPPIHICPPPLPSPIYQALPQTLLPPPLPNLQSFSNLTLPLSTGTVLPSFPLPFPPLGSLVTSMPSHSMTHTTSTNETSRCLTALKEVSLPPVADAQNKSVLLTLTRSQRSRQRRKARARKKAKISALESCNTSLANIAIVKKYRLCRKKRRLAAKARAAAAAAGTAVLPVVVADSAPAASPAMPLTPAKPVIVLRLKSGEVLGPTRPAAKAEDMAGVDTSVI